jgi:RNA polymerase sigma-70 factor (ECF subfamily)
MMFFVAMAAEELPAYPNWYSQYGALMRQIACRYVGPDAEDVVSESVLALLRHEDQLNRMDSRALARYIMVTVRHTAINALRRSHRTVPVDITDLPVPEHGQPENRLMVSEQLNALREAMSALPAKERQVIYLKVIENRSDEEIAACTGLSAASVPQYVARARKKLKSRLSYDSEGGEDA